MRRGAAPRDGLRVLAALACSALAAGGSGAVGAADGSGVPAAGAHAGPAAPVAVLDLPTTMARIVDPAADLVWDAAGFIDTLEGSTDLTPTTAAGWQRVEFGAAVIAESGGLLLLPGRAVDDPRWRTEAARMQAVGRDLYAAARARDGARLFDLGATLYEVCTACHATFWQDGQARFVEAR